VSERRYADLSRLGHNLKGTCGIYGLKELEKLGEQLEDAALRQEDEGIEALVGSLARLLEGVPGNPLPTPLASAG